MSAELASADVPDAESGPVERGRYAVFSQPDGGILIARAGPLCGRCEACGCGQQRDPVGPISGALVRLAQAAASGEMTMAGALKRMIRL